MKTFLAFASGDRESVARRFAGRRRDGESLLVASDPESSAWNEIFNPCSDLMSSRVRNQ